MKQFEKGNFVKVGEEVGVVIFLENEQETPEEHLGIWYGETNAQGKPRCRTVPTAYCEIIEAEAIEKYH